MLNPFFIQGTSLEQGLVQDLINEQLRMYGIEVYYMPRQIVTKGTVIKDVIYSKFKTAFPIEAYLSTFDGFESNSIVMSKFGVRITDQMTLIISKERFELYIAELMKYIPEVENTLRPNEGDLIYVPLSDSIMEIKYVENRKPFYQLQKNYVYELNCELYEYEDEIISTGVEEVDYSIKDIGYGAILTLAELGDTATAYTGITTNSVQFIEIISGGYRYSTPPSILIEQPKKFQQNFSFDTDAFTFDSNTITFDTLFKMIDGINATAVGVITSASKLTGGKSLSKVYIENPGKHYSYSDPPNVSIVGGGGYGAKVKVGIATTGSIGIITLTYAGKGYYQKPNVTISPPGIGGTTAIAEAFLDGNGGISTIRIVNAGYGYTQAPIITISAGSTISSGNYDFGEKIYGSLSSASGYVKDWNPSLKELRVVGMGTDFKIGDVIVGETSNASYIIRKYSTYELVNAYSENDVIEQEADNIIDFTEVNPFGDL